MRTDNQFFKSIALTALLFAGFTAGSIAQDTPTINNPEKEKPVILTTTPTDGEENVDLSNVFEITFNSEMNESTINGTTLLLHATSADSMHEMMHEMDHEMDSQMMADQRDDPRQDRTAIKDSEKKVQGTAGTVKGTISYSDKVAVFTPNEELKEGTQYTFIVTNGVKSSENVALENEYKWSFTTTGTSDLSYSDERSERGGERVRTDRKDEDEKLRADRKDEDERETADRSETMYRTAGQDSPMDTKSIDKADFVELGKAGQFVILAKTDIHNQSGSNITGQTGEGSLTDKDKKEKAFTDSVRKSTTDRVAVWQEDQSDTTSSDVSEAIEDMMTAYNSISSQNGDRDQYGYDFDQNRDQDIRQDRNQDMRQDRAQDRSQGQDRHQDRDAVTTHQDDHIPDEDLKPGVHQWSNALNVHPDFTLSGSEDDVWVFKVGGDLSIDEDFVLTLSDGAQADNIFWYVEGEVTIGKNAQFEGIILSMNEITLEKGAKLNGRMFSQASINLDDNTVTEPRDLASQTTSTNR